MCSSGSFRVSGLTWICLICLKMFCLGKEIWLLGHSFKCGNAVELGEVHSPSWPSAHYTFAFLTSKDFYLMFTSKCILALHWYGRPSMPHFILKVRDIRPVGGFTCVGRVSPQFPGKLMLPSLNSLCVYCMCCCLFLRCALIHRTQCQPLQPCTKSWHWLCSFSIKVITAILASSSFHRNFRQSYLHAQRRLL